MKKLAFIYLILLLVMCGCGKTYTLQEQQVEFKAWNQEFHHEVMTVHAIIKEEGLVLQDLVTHKITPADADIKFKQFNERRDQAIQFFSQPPEVKTLSKDDRRLLQDAYKAMAIAVLHEKIGGEERLKSMKALADPTAPRYPDSILLENNLVINNMEKAGDSIKKVASHLNVSLQDQ